MIPGCYYEALTMFFTDEVTASFQSELEIFKAYPDWSLKLKYGSELQLPVNADVGNDVNVKLIYNFPNKILNQSVAKVMNRIQSRPTAIYESTKNLRQYYYNSPEDIKR